MEQQIAQLGSLDGEAVRACKRYETLLDQSSALEEGHEKEFGVLRDATTALTAKRKLLQQARDALLGLQGYLEAEAPRIAASVATGAPRVGEFFSTAIARGRYEIEGVCEGMALEVRLDLGALDRAAGNVIGMLGLDDGLNMWRKWFDDRTAMLAKQSEYMVNVARVVEKTVGSALDKLGESRELAVEAVTPPLGEVA